MSLHVRQIAEPFTALGIATHFLARRAPFTDFRFGDLVNTLDGQVRRKHALFALDGPKIVGYLGWAVYSAADALQFARTGRPPALDRANGSEVVWLLTAAATTPSALKMLIDAGKNLNAGRRVMGVRHKPSGKRVLFDQLIAERRYGTS